MHPYKSSGSNEGIQNLFEFSIVDTDYILSAAYVELQVLKFWTHDLLWKIQKLFFVAIILKYEVGTDHYKKSKGFEPIAWSHLL